MTNHNARVISIPNQRYQGRCACRQHGPVEVHEWAADDWVRRHLATVERVRLHLTPTPSLPMVARLYREASLSPDYTCEQQAMWATMADEIEQRIAPPAEQLVLF